MSRFSTAFGSQKLPQLPNDDAGSFGDTRIATLLCAIGFFMRIFLSGPTLNIIGIDYGSDNAGWLGRIHPGSLIILLSFVVLLASGGNPLAQIWRLAQKQTAFFSFIVIYVLIFIYWAARDPKGISLILDEHIVMPMTAIVFATAPRVWAKRLAYAFACTAILNSIVGIGEAITHLRLFPYDPEWEVLQQDYFRASAFLGHPLTNASFTVVSMFILLDMKMPVWLKTVTLGLMLAALVAFGGRAALILGILSLILLGVVQLWHATRNRPPSVARLSLLLLSGLAVPVLVAGLLYGTLHSGMGERLLAYNTLNDESAEVRAQSLTALEKLSDSDLIFGMSGDRVADTINIIGLSSPGSDIENPWILMFLFLGAILFPFWLGGLTVCITRLISGSSLALTLAVLDYFLISSTSNSFGRKDQVFIIMAGAIVCAKRLKDMQKT